LVELKIAEKLIKQMLAGKKTVRENKESLRIA